MSATWYECKVKYRKTDDIGAQKVTTEPYLVDAISYTEAESRINEEMAAYVSEEFKITNIKVTAPKEITNSLGVLEFHLRNRHVLYTGEQITIKMFEKTYVFTIDEIDAKKLIQQKEKLLGRIKCEKTGARKHESRKKFFNGLYAAYSGIVINNEGYINSVLFSKILDDVKEHLDSDLDIEHQLYLIGERFLKLNKNDGSNLESIKKIAGEDWKTVRFQNVVRLGADIENAGLETLPRATLVGALLYQKEKRKSGN